MSIGPQVLNRIELGQVKFGNRYTQPYGEAARPLVATKMIAGPGLNLTINPWPPVRASWGTAATSWSHDRGLIPTSWLLINPLRSICCDERGVHQLPGEPLLSI